MTKSAIRLVSALACEDLREDANGKLIATGILGPAMHVTRPKDIEKAPPMKIFFLVVVDFLEATRLQMKFRFKDIGTTINLAQTKDITVTQVYKNVPLEVGPFFFKPEADDKGFELQFSSGGRWKTIARWLYVK
jgi:hypothetical protein